MRFFPFEKADLYMSEDQYESQITGRDTSPEQFLSIYLSRFFGNYPLYEAYIEKYGQINGLEKIALLAAHGDNEGGWTYIDGNKSLPVQDWIDKNDGKYKALLLCVCNPDHEDVAYKRSIIMLPDTEIDFRASDSAVFSLLIPKIGEVDGYTIKYELEQLGKL